MNFPYFPLITDPFFYAVAAPAVLLMGISKSGFGAGFGSLAVPLIALAVTVPQAAAILMPILLAVDLLGLAAFRKNFDRDLLKFLIPLGLVGTVIGALLFKVLDAHVVAAIVGGCTLLFLAQRLLLPLAPVGVWVGVRIAKRIDPVLFYRLIYLGMLLTGTKLLWDGFH